MRLSRLVVLGLILPLLAACQTNDLMEPPADLGDFVLGLNIVVAEHPVTVPISRVVEPEEIQTAMTKAIQDRFGRYEGSRIYNIGISVDGYALAPPGVPVLLKPQSALIITANIWDDGTQTKLNSEAKQITVLEKLDADTAIGSGWTRNKHKQLEVLTYNAAKAVETWLLENPEWFNLPPLPTDGTEAAKKPAAAKAAPTPGKTAPNPAAQRPPARPLDFPAPNG